MKFIITAAITLAVSGVSAIPAPRHHHNHGAGNGTASPIPAAGITTTTTTTSVPTSADTTGGAVARGTSTIVLFEINGVPGNECLTFRNNGIDHYYLVVITNPLTAEQSGEIVDAACVDDSADRQMTPSTNAAGEATLLVQRTFSSGFRPDLSDAGVQACIGNNGTDFLSQDCAAATDLVSFTGGQLVAASGACASGHDGLAQLTIDPTGAICATYTSTTVTPAAV